MPDERKPDVKKCPHCGSTNLVSKWFWGQIRVSCTDCGEMLRDDQPGKKATPDGRLTNPEYIRNSHCGVCKGNVTARRIMNGWIIKCDCSETFTKEFSPPNNKIWKRRYG